MSSSQTTLPALKRSSTSTALAFGNADGVTREGSRLRARSLVGAGRPDGDSMGDRVTGFTSLMTLDELASPRRSETSDSGSSDDLGPPTPQDDVAARQRMSFDLGKLPSMNGSGAGSSSFMSIVIPPTPAGEGQAPLLGRRFSQLFTAGASSSSTAPPAIAAIGPSSTPPDARPPLRHMARPLAVLAVVFVTSTAIVFALVASVPTLALPHSLAEVVSLADRLRQYSASGPRSGLHVFVVLSALFMWKQAFSTVSAATLFTCILTAVGSTGAYGLAYFCEPLVRAYTPRPIEALERRIDDKARRPRELFSSLLLWRLAPIVPYSILNLAAGVLRLPLLPFFTSLVLGSVPYNVVTCEAGSLLLSSGAGTESVWSARMGIKLFLISAIAAIPVVFKERLQRLLGGEDAADAMALEPLTQGGDDTPPHASSDDEGDVSSPIWRRRKASVFDASADVAERGEVMSPDTTVPSSRIPCVTIAGPTIW